MITQILNSYQTEFGKEPIFKSLTKNSKIIWENMAASMLTATSFEGAHSKHARKVTRVIQLH
jgi:hypothetical protein